MLRRCAPCAVTCAGRREPWAVRGANFAIWQVCHTGDPQPSRVDAGMTALVTAMRRLRASGTAGIAPAFAMTPLLLCVPRAGKDRPRPDELEKFGRLLGVRGSRGPRDLLRCSNTGNRLFDFWKPMDFQVLSSTEGLLRRLGFSNPKGGDFDLQTRCRSGAFRGRRVAAKDTGDGRTQGRAPEPLRAKTHTVWKRDRYPCTKLRWTHVTTRRGSRKTRVVRP